jgi:hypothetical protein
VRPLSSVGWAVDHNETLGTVQEALALVRADGDNGAVSFDLESDYCRVRTDDSLSPVSGIIAVNSGDGFILIKKGTDACP